MLRIIVIFLFVVCHAIMAEAVPYVGTHTRNYTDAEPLIYEDAWEKWPYAFINDRGEPDGFNVELVKKMMKRLGIPYKIQLQSQRKAHEDLKGGKVDLSFGVAAEYNAPFGRFGRVTVSKFENALLQLRTDSTGPLNIEDLRHHNFLVKSQSRAYYYLLENGFPDSTLTVVDNMDTEVLRIVTEGHGEVLWNTMMLKWMVNKYHIKNFTVTPVDIPSGEYRMMSGDTLLLHRLDSLCEVMTAEGELDRMVHHWMYPELQIQDTSYIYITVISVFVFVIVIIVIMSMHYYRKYYSINSLFDVNSQMGLILTANHIQVWVYNPLTRRYAWMTRDGKVEQEYSSFEFSKFYPGEDFNIIHTQVMEFLSQEEKPVIKKLRSYSLNNPDVVLDVEVHMEVLKDDYGKIYLVCGVQHDITDSKGALERTRQLHERHKTAFNIAPGGILRFNGEGRLVDLNKRICVKLGISSPEEVLKKNYTLDDFGIMRDIDIYNCPDDLRFSAIIKNEDMHNYMPIADMETFNPDTETYNELLTQEEQERVRHIISQMGYYYLHIIKSHDKNGKLISVLLYINDITEITILQKMMIRMERHAKVLQKDLNTLLRRRDHLMNESDIFMLRYYPKTRQLLVYNREENRMLPLSQLQVLEILDRKDMKKMFKVFRQVDAYASRDLHINIATMLRNAEGHYLNYSIDAHLVYDGDEKEPNYFGICRDITSQINVQRQLKEETKKAREAEIVKQNFLKNMSYSIRQPLVTMRQSIELLSHNDTSEQQEQQLLNNITLNTQRLITLSDDTLLLSRIEAGLVIPNEEELDFVKIYRQSVDSALSELRTDAVIYNIAEPYQSLIIRGDKDIFSRILFEAVRLSATYTRFGTLNVRYLYHNTNITIAIEDTGQGLPPAIMENIYEPQIGVSYSNDMMSSQNYSGLEMPICHAYVTLLNGTIDIDSDPGRGTSIYINLPLKTEGE